MGKTERLLRMVGRVSRHLLEFAEFAGTVAVIVFLGFAAMGGFAFFVQTISK